MGCFRGRFGIVDYHRRFPRGNILALGKRLRRCKRQEALRLFNALIAAIYGGDAGEELGDWPLGTYGRESKADPINYTQDQLQRPTINRRFVAVNTTALTVYLTVWPQDGARMGIADPFRPSCSFPVTLDANGRTIEGAATKTSTRTGFFRNGSIMRISGSG